MRFVRLLLASVLLWGLVMPPANAFLWSGGCLLSLRFDFSEPVGTHLTAPDYTIKVEPLVDLDPLKSGTQPCLMTLDTFEPSRTTTVSASGSSTEWSCAAVLSSGSWNQSWSTAGGSSSPPAIFGSHTLTGTWGNWVLTIRDQSLSAVGVAHLTLDSSEVLGIAGCPLVGRTSIRMVGALVFQDP